MKRLCQLLTICLLPLTGGWAAVPYDVSETDLELYVSGDYDGDGRVDLAIIDRVTGTVRVGLAGPDGSVTLENPVPSGLTEVASAGSGPDGPGSADELILASRSGNRIHRLDFTNPAVNPHPQPILVKPFGPRVIATPVLALAGFVDDHFDLILFSDANGNPNRYLTWTDPLNQPEENAFLTEPTGDVAAIVPYVISGTGSIATLERQSAADVLFLYDAETGFISDDATTTAGSRFVAGHFVTPWSPIQFVAYVPGGNVLDIILTSGVGQGIDEQGSISLSKDSITFVQAVRRESGFDQLLVVTNDGANATLYAITGDSSFTLEPLQTFAIDAPDSRVIGAISDESNFLHFLERDTDGSNLAVTIEHYQDAGSGYTLTGRTRIQPAAATQPGIFSNVIAFDREPFVSEDAGVLERYRVRDWTTTASAGTSITATAADYEGTSQGIGTGSAVNLGPAPAGANFALPNQFRADASLFSLDKVGPDAGSIVVRPVPGIFDRAVNVSLTPSPGMNIYYRTDPTAFWTIAVQPVVVGPFFAETSIEFFGRRGSLNTPIQVATYRFTRPPELLDSDGDLVPDFVEVAGNVDPLSSGPDADGDSVSDLEEALRGTDLSDPCDHPLRLEDNVINRPEDDRDSDLFSNVFEERHCTDPDNAADFPTNLPILRANLGKSLDLAVTPRSHLGDQAHSFGFSLPRISDSNPDRATLLNIYTTDGLSEGFTYTQSGGLSLPGPYALFEDLLPSRYQILGSVATAAGFELNAAISDPFIGRELVALLDLPVFAPPQVNFVWGNQSTLSQEVTAWRTAAVAAYATPPAPVERVIDYRDTLILLLVEEAIETALQDRGTLAADVSLTLTPYRISESPKRLTDPGLVTGDFVRLDLIEFAALEVPVANPLSTYQDGLVLALLIENIRSAIAAPPDSETQALIDAAREIYRISAAFENGSPSEYPSPVDELRAFIETGALSFDTADPDPDFGYRTQTVLASGVLPDAFLAARNLTMADASLARQRFDSVLSVRADSFDQPCPILEDAAMSTLYSLVTPGGTPYRLPTDFNLPAGSQVRVTGYADFGTSCGQTALAVDSLSLIDLPTPAPVDTNGNLIDDALENLIGAQNADPFDDPDGDQYSTAQEVLEGTNPFDSLSFPMAPVVELVPPVVAVSIPTDSTLTFNFTFPQEYADRYSFELESSADLASPFVNTGLTAQQLAAGEFELGILIGAADRAFYRFRMRLK